MGSCLPCSVSWRAAFAMLLGFSSLADSLQAGEVADRDSKPREQMEASLDWYKLFASENAREPLKSQVVMRWRNSVRGEQATDILALWVDKGRPVACASIFPWEGKLCHEFGSLSRESGLTARDGDGIVWAPSTGGVEFRDVPNAPRPADTGEMRLRQIKSISQQFTAILIGWKQDGAGPEVLRLLPRPLYRYALTDQPNNHLDLQDGALLAFVQGTDPEVLLLLEAVVVDKHSRWQYALARSTSGSLEVRLKDHVIWKVDELSDAISPKTPQIVLRRPIKE